MAGFIIWLIIIFAVVAINRRGVQMRSSSGTRGAGASFGAQQTASSATRRTASSGGQTNSGPVSGGGDILSRAKASVEEDFGQTWEQQEEQRRHQEEQKRQARERQEEQRRQARKRQEEQRRRQEEQKRQAKERQKQSQTERVRQQQKAAGWRQDAAVMHAKELEQYTQEMQLDGGLSVDPRRFMGQDENFDLDAVWDLMVKGPNLELTFERDFIAEGVEMLNRIQA